MKSNKTKSVMTALVVAAMVCTAAMPIKAAESQWINDNGTWSYVKEDGSKAKGWIKDNGCWYAFDDNGSMRTGWVASHEHWYFMGESGVMQSNAWVEENGARYFIKGTGVMAKDYVKDGYELTSDGKAIPLAETNSVVVTDPSAVEGQVIEGNLYVDVTTAKELELKGVTVKGKLVIIGDNQTAGKVTVTDSKIEAISTQTRNAEVVLSGETAVKEIVIEETSVVTPDKNFKGEVEKIEVQSTTKGEIKIEVPAQEVSTRTYASVDIQAPVEHLEVKTDTQVKVNADVKNVVVTESAKDTKVEVSKGNTVGTIVADAPVKIEGSGTVNKVEANVDGVEAGEDTVIKDVETGKDVTTAPEVSKPEKPSTGGGSTGGGSTGGGTEKPTLPEVKTYAWETWNGSLFEKNNDGTYTFKGTKLDDTNNGLNGPMTKDLHSTVANGGKINEAVTVKINPAQYKAGESFGVSVGVNDNSGNRITELAVDFIWASDTTLAAEIAGKQIVISKDGYYTLRWIIDGSKENLTATFIVTTENGEKIGEVTNIQLQDDNENIVKSKDCSTARYMWFYRVPTDGLIVKNVKIKEIETTPAKVAIRRDGPNSMAADKSNYGTKDTFYYSKAFEGAGAVIKTTSGKAIITLPRTFNENNVKALEELKGNTEHGATTNTSYVGLEIEIPNDAKSFKSSTDLTNLGEAKVIDDTISYGGCFMEYISIAQKTENESFMPASELNTTLYYQFLDEEGKVLETYSLTIERKIVDTLINKTTLQTLFLGESYQKSVSDLGQVEFTRIDDTKYKAIGTLEYITGWTAYQGDEANGNYIVFDLDVTGYENTAKTKVQLADGTEKVREPNETATHTWVIRIRDDRTPITISVDLEGNGVYVDYTIDISELTLNQSTTEQEKPTTQPDGGNGETDQSGEDNTTPGGSAEGNNGGTVEGGQDSESNGGNTDTSTPSPEGQEA